MQAKINRSPPAASICITLPIKEFVHVYKVNQNNKLMIAANFSFSFFLLFNRFEIQSTSYN